MKKIILLLLFVIACSQSTEPEDYGWNGSWQLIPTGFSGKNICFDQPMDIFLHVVNTDSCFVEGLGSTDGKKWTAKNISESAFWIATFTNPCEYELLGTFVDGGGWEGWIYINDRYDSNRQCTTYVTATRI